MKTRSLLLVLLFTITGIAYAQKGTSELTIKSSTVCEMCKTKIEKELVFEKGVKEVKVDIAAKTVWVRYKTDKTSPEKIKTALTNIGYKADDMPANEKAFEKLPACCKAEGCGK
ncbi:MAG: heavy-metal-associated domain-containing protein [Bacteroidota bacterium]